MKILALASLLATVIICPPVEARSIQASKQEILRNVEINGEKTPYVGELNLDFINSLFGSSTAKGTQLASSRRSSSAFCRLQQAALHRLLPTGPRVHSGGEP